MTVPRNRTDTGGRILYWVSAKPRTTGSDLGHYCEPSRPTRCDLGRRVSCFRWGVHALLSPTGPTSLRYEHSHDSGSPCYPARRGGRWVGSLSASITTPFCTSAKSAHIARGSAIPNHVPKFGRSTRSYPVPNRLRHHCGEQGYSQPRIAAGGFSKIDHPRRPMGARATPPSIRYC